MFVLDTDHLGVLQRLRGQEYENLIARLSRYRQSEKSFIAVQKRAGGLRRWTS